MAEAKKKEVQALKGVKQILMFRLLEEKNKKDAQKLLFQVEHSSEVSADGDSEITKDGPLNSEGVIEEEISITSIVALGDDTVDILEKAMRERKSLEVWEINTQDPVGEEKDHKFTGRYMQGKLTEFNKTSNAEDYVELEMAFKVDLVPQKGECTLTEEQSKVVQYPFRDTTKELQEV